MPGGSLGSRIHRAPRVSDANEARRRLSDLASAPSAEELAPRLGLAFWLERRPVRRLLLGIADHSPFLWHLIANDPARLARLLEVAPEASLSRILEGLAAGAEESEAEVMRRLRQGRQEVALLVALADLGGVWDLDEVTAALSRAADRLIGLALDHLVRAAAVRGRLRGIAEEAPASSCGLAILGLGKLGGYELNYSSDVDLIAIFDPTHPAVPDPDAAKPLFVRIVQDLVRLLQQPTADGFALRVDLRLRPDPGSTAVAIAIDAAFLYYESFGQNWERAAMIKARPVAGDMGVARRFLDELAPFVWRKYFDYAAIADVHAMKRQIHAAKGHGEIAVAGHDVKLGRGGIREIEFFVQTQQLIFGGKQARLRGSRTLPMLRALREAHWIGTRAVAELSTAYRFLRRTEHRLQMLADEQTQKLPRRPEDLARFARFSGFAGTEAFARVLTRHFRAVAGHYARLFEAAPSLDDSTGSLVFTGVGDDPETLETLAQLGYVAPARIAETVRGWHSGRRAGVTSPRARETLTDLVPKLLVAFARTADPDGAVATFDEALQRMPAAAELFALLTANAELRALFADMLGGAPRLARELALRPHLLDGAIDPGRALSCDEDEMQRRAAAAVARQGSTEAKLDAIRDFHHEEHFLVSLAILTGEIDGERAGEAFAALATGIVRVLLDTLEREFNETYGAIEGGAVAVLAMGKLGSREMTATSDLDLILLYTFDEEAPTSKGPRSLHAVQYYTRMTQRLVAYLTAATRRGRLYEVDMRLRPSGRQGPIATKLSAFALYQQGEAATWERQALTRARVIAGGDAFSRRVAEEVRRALRRPPEARLAAEVLSMRERIAREKVPAGPYDFKLLPGGLIDVEFIAQYIVLRHAHAYSDLLTTGTLDILRIATRLGLIDVARGETLIAAHRLYTGVTQIMRLAFDAEGDLDRAGEGVRRRVAQAVAAPDFPSVVRDLDETRQAVRETFLVLLSSN